MVNLIWFSFSYHYPYIVFSGNRKESNEALQLFLRLLDENERLELQHLLSFLYIVQSENFNFHFLFTSFIKLIQFPKMFHCLTDIQISAWFRRNLQQLCSQYAQTICSSSVSIDLTKLSSKKIFKNRKMIETNQNLFRLPEAIDRQIKKKSQLIRDGQIDSPHAIPDALFAKQVKKFVFNPEAPSCTKNCTISAFFCAIWSPRGSMLPGTQG